MKRINVEFGREIALAREYRGWTQQDLADAITALRRKRNKKAKAVYQPYISRLEMGYHLPHDDSRLLEDLGSALKSDSDHFYGILFPY